MASNTIALTADIQRDSLLASGTVYPGYLLERTSAADVASAGTAKAHATEGGYAEKLVALEDGLQGGTVDDAYSDGERMLCGRPKSGERIQLMLEAGQDGNNGDFLISAGNGKVIVNGQEASGTTVKQIVAVLEEDSDLSGSGAEDTLVAARMM